MYRDLCSCVRESFEISCHQELVIKLGSQIENFHFSKTLSVAVIHESQLRLPFFCTNCILRRNLTHFCFNHLLSKGCCSLDQSIKVIDIRLTAASCSPKPHSVTAPTATTFEGRLKKLVGDALLSSCLYQALSLHKLCVNNWRRDYPRRQGFNERRLRL